MGWFESFVTSVVMAPITIAQSVVQSTVNAISDPIGAISSSFSQLTSAVTTLTQPIIDAMPQELRQAAKIMLQMPLMWMIASTRALFGACLYVIGSIIGDDDMKSQGATDFMVGNAYMFQVWGSLPPILQFAIMIVISCVCPWIWLIWIAVALIVVLLLTQETGGYVSSMSKEDQFVLIGELDAWGLLTPEQHAMYEQAKAHMAGGSQVRSLDPTVDQTAHTDSGISEADAAAQAAVQVTWQQILNGYLTGLQTPATPTTVPSSPNPGTTEPPPVYVPPVIPTPSPSTPVVPTSWAQNTGVLALALGVTIVGLFSQRDKEGTT